MNLNVSFDELHAAVGRMGAPIVDFTIDLDMGAVDPIDIELQKGLKISLDEVEHKNGLLSHKGRQVLLYIQDQGRRVREVLEDGATGRKYHVADCSTLEEMREKSRFERYVVTNDFSPDFFVSGTDWDTREEVEGDALLKVCKNCLKKLNYQGYGASGNKKEVFSVFELEKFFSTYSSFFPYLPSRFAGPSATNNYTDDWSSISKKYRESLHFVCEGEGCELDLSKHSSLLHVHHVNGVKTANQRANLMALCIVCHSKQPCHGHMFVSHKDRQIITCLRREQKKLGANNWDEVIAVADPGVNGLALMCKQNHLPVPEVGREIRGNDHSVVVQLELAWPDRRIGVAIDVADASGVKAEGWTIWEVVDALDKFDTFSGQINRY